MNANDIIRLIGKYDGQVSTYDLEDTDDEYPFEDVMCLAHFHARKNNGLTTVMNEATFYGSAIGRTIKCTYNTNDDCFRAEIAPLGPPDGLLPEAIYNFPLY